MRRELSSVELDAVVFDIDDGNKQRGGAAASASTLGNLCLLAPAVAHGLGRNA